MVILIVLILGGIGAAFFATQNTQTTSITFWQYTFPHIPIYLVALGALFLGIIISWLVNLVSEISSLLTLQGKEGKIKEIARENAELLKKIHQLEIENAKLKTRLGEEDVDENSI